MTHPSSLQLAQWLPERSADSHKGHFGHAVIVAGSPAMPGAALLSLLGARRSGVGRMSWVADEQTVSRAHGLPPEVLLRARPGMQESGASKHSVAARWQACLADATAVLVGPGLDCVEATREALLACGARGQEPTALCIDADGLRLVAAQPMLLAPLSGRVVLTPHPGEMAALCGVSTAEVQADRMACASRLADAHGAVVILKGANTVVAAPQQAPVSLAVGGPELSHAGTGDVLAGVVVGLMAQGLPLFAAAQAGVVAHGLAGAHAREMHGMAGTTASDVAEALGAVWRQAGR